MHIAVIGTGYVGLVTGACFAEFGVDVTCVDVDEQKIERLNDGVMPIYEPGLEQLVTKNTQAGRLRFTTNVGEAVEQALVIFLAVGTPPKDDGSPDLSFIEAAATSIADHLHDYKVIVTKSTVPIGTGEHIRSLVNERKKSRANFGVVSNPEFLREGAAINDFMRPDRVVIGSRDQEAIAIMKDLYRPLYLIEAPFVITSLEAAELTKYAANAFLATKVSFINEIANLCERIGCDVHDVARGIGMDKRIGSKFLHPGPGFGGSCFPKDTRALVKIAQDHDVQLRIVEAVLGVNEIRKRAMARKVANAAGSSLRGKTVAVLGLTFKPDTDDMREAPSIPLVTGLLDMGAKVRAHDPVGMEQARKELPDIAYFDDPYACTNGADAMVVVTEWVQYRTLDLERLKREMAQPVVIDLRNIYRPEDMAAHGFVYESVGRPAEPRS